MYKFAKRFFSIAAGFLVATAIVLLCINLYLQSDGVQQRIRDAALRSLGTEVKIRSTMYTPWSGLVLRGISVADPTNANLNIVEATALRVRFSLVPLLNNCFVITECTLFEPKLIVRQLENGDWLIPLPAARAQAREASKEASPSPANPVEGVLLQGGTPAIPASQRKHRFPQREEPCNSHFG